MPGPDPRILVHLAAARSSIDAALALLAPAQVELPEGVERPAPSACPHPAERRMRHMGGHWTCKDCGYHE